MRSLPSFSSLWFPLTIAVSLIFSGPLLGDGTAVAEPINITFSNILRGVRSPNRVNFTPGDRIGFSLNATPNPDPIPLGSGGDGGTSVSATTTVLDVTDTELTPGTVVQEPLFDLESPALPDAFGTSRAFDPGLAGDWTFTVQNPDSDNSPQMAGPISLTDPDTGKPFGISEFVKDMKLTGTGTTPTVEWTLPGGFAPDNASILIFDLDNPEFPPNDQSPEALATEIAPIIHTEFDLDPTGGSFSIPAMLDCAPNCPGGPVGETNGLVFGRNYSIDVRLEEERDDGSVASRSNSFFEFQPLAAGAPDVFLPIVDPEGSPTGGPVYQFDVEVQDGGMIFIDPLVAVGYDFAIGEGDPNFASVLLPDLGVGDNLFDLLLFDGADFVHTATLVGGEEFSFINDLDLTEGVEQFRILGIEPALGLDPFNTTAFITGLTFAGVGDGDRFTGTMTPITASVPEPTTLALIAIGIAGLGFRRWAH